ncbi:hypothetical protein FO519_005892 [Halicephalobus sp. NKZ332]|nr:hypothetical protein FO519_005892 [Halicephalobus sp. NKZ332]
MRWSVFILIFGFCSLSESSLEGPEGEFKLLRIWPKTSRELQIVKEVYNSSSEFELDFWKAPTILGAFVDVMVSPKITDSIRKFLDKNEIEYKVTVEDVQKKIIEKEIESPESKIDFGNPLLRSFFKRAKDTVYVSRNKAKYNFGDYHSYEKMLNWMEEIEKNYPGISKTFIAGKTHEGREIKGIKIGSPISKVDKRAVWIDGGIHAREWAAIHTALYFIEQLIAGYGIDPTVTSYVDNLNFYVLPVANPDGFEYSRSDVTPQTRFWRKNRGNIVCKKDRWRRERCCGGVDLNRNFDFHFGESGSSNDICSDIYQGTSAFSEPESRAIRDKIQSPELWGKVDAFITLHTYSQMWIHPFNHERKSFPSDIQDLQEVGMKGVAAIEAMYGTKYKFGTGADILYPSAGGSDDWAKAKAGVKYVYLLELRPGEEQWDGFLLDRKQLIPTSRETWEGVKVVLDAVLKRARPELFSSTQPSTTSSTPSSMNFRSPQTASTRQLFQQNRPQFNLRNTLHERLNRLRQQQLKARRDFEARNAQQRDSQNDPRRFQTVSKNNQWVQTDTSASVQQAGNCFDRSRWCSGWISSTPNICQTSTIYMQKDCRRSCGFC